MKNDSCIEQLKRLYSGIKYVNNVLDTEDLEAWQRKEYLAVLTGYVIEKDRLENIIKMYPALFVYDN